MTDVCMLPCRFNIWVSVVQGHFCRPYNVPCLRSHVIERPTAIVQVIIAFGNFMFSVLCYVRCEVFWMYKCTEALPDDPPHQGLVV
jgi:hypothetical protein